MARVLALSTETSLSRRWPRAFAGWRAPHRLVGETSNIDEAALLRDELDPDVIVLELGRPRDESVAACERLSAGNAPVVAVAPALDDEERAELLSAGATGYVLTTIEDDGFAIALQAVAEVAGPERPHADLPVASSTIGTSRSQFLRMTGVAAAAAYVAPKAARAQTKPVETNPSPSSPTALPKLPAPRGGESDMLRMQREIVSAMGKPVGERRWVMVVDLRKCSGCDACTIACKAENQLPPGVVYRPVVQEEVGTYPNVSRRFLTRPCMQCEKPPCTPRRPHRRERSLLRHLGQARARVGVRCRGGRGRVRAPPAGAMLMVFPLIASQLDPQHSRPAVAGRGWGRCAFVPAERSVLGDVELLEPRELVCNSERGRRFRAAWRTRGVLASR
jgi:DNA-binding NarL/FixJ family response regulator